MGSMLKQRKWTLTLLCLVYASRIGMGLYLAIWGPTLIYLSEQTGGTVADVSSIFIGRSIGIMIGAFFASYTRKLKVVTNKIYSLSIALSVFFVGISTAVIPLSTNLLPLILNTILGGLAYGFAETALQSLILHLWGESNSRVHIQTFHFTYSIGAITAPFLAKVFSEVTLHSSPACMHTHNGEDTYNYTGTNVINPEDQLDKINGSQHLALLNIEGAGWSFVVIGCYVLIVSVLLLIMTFVNVESRIVNELELKGKSSEVRKEENISSALKILIPTFVYLFCAAAIEGVFHSFIYTIAICSELAFTSDQANILTAVYWLGFTFGRLVAIPASTKLSPRTIISTSALIISLAASVMSIWGESQRIVTWGGSLVLGAFTSTLFPSGVSWVSKMTNVSRRYSCIFTLAAGFGNLSMLPLAGFIYELRPFAVIYVLFALSVTAGLFIWITNKVGKKHATLMSYNEENEPMT